VDTDTGRGHFVLRFGEFELDTNQRVVTRLHDGVRVRLTPRVHDTLQYLVEHAGQLVTKSALLEAVWAGVVVEDGNLTQTIHVLRRALGESPHEHRYVVTVPGRGYRFVAEVTVVDLEQPPAPEPLVRDRPGSHRISVAIAAGVLLAASTALLARFERDAGPTAQVESASLVPFGSSVGKPLSLAPSARELLSQGQFFFYRRGSGDLERAREYLEQAQAIDPEDAAVAAALAGVYLSLRAEGMLEPAAALELQRVAAQRAVQLDPEFADAHLRLAQYYWASSNDDAAERHFERALALDPERPLALGMRASWAACAGQLEEAVALQRRSVAQEPLAATQRVNLGVYLLAAGRLEEAEAEFLQVENLNPGLGDRDLALTLILQHRHDAALARILRWEPGAMQDQALAMVYYGLGQQLDADAAMDRLRARAEPGSRLQLAEVLAMRGESEAALEYIGAGRAPTLAHDSLPAEQSEFDRLELQLSPFFVRLRQDRRWEALLARS
jgi:DNA-binding winged helix-turn-helix (wHTH) protein/Tfp pilus assembly protein PilF